MKTPDWVFATFITFCCIALAIPASHEAQFWLAAIAIGQTFHLCCQIRWYEEFRAMVITKGNDNGK